MPQETAVLFANEAFYLTFTNHDAVAMDAIWSKREMVTCIHPGWPPLRGRNPVVQSWRDIFDNPNAPEITCQNARAYVYGTMAYVLCTEVLANGQLAATNIFVFEEGNWKIVHHQASPIPKTAPKPLMKRPTLQ